MSKNQKTLLVFADINHHEGHKQDFRSALRRALDKVSYSIFDDLPKIPLNRFSVMIKGILLHDAVLIDGAHITNSLSPNALIQYGICYALEKKCTVIIVKNNSKESLMESKSKFIDAYREFDYYLDLATQLKPLLSEGIDSPKPIRQITPNKLAVHSFITFGIDQWNNPDIREAILDFCSGKEWTPRMVRDISSLSKIESLARAVSQRSFCLFYLDKSNSQEIFLGVGLAIGAGRPFLIIKHKDVELPTALNGYHGIIEYANFNHLKDQLSKYTNKFLSDEVLNWEGVAFNDLLSQFEKQIGSTSAEKLDELESVLLTVNSVIGDINAKPCALLGEVYREKNRKTSPGDVELLRKAKDYYEKALNIQKEYQLYQNAITAIDKHIQLIELIQNNNYPSIPILINIIGGDIKSEQYAQIKEYLLSVVKQLVNKKKFAHAISLVTAMQIHDDSEYLQNLVKHILDTAPLDIIKALQDSQKHSVELESTKTELLLGLKEKDEQITGLNKKFSDLNSENMNKISKISEERDTLREKLEGINSQLTAIKENKEKLERTISENTVKGTGDEAKAQGIRAILVNFGFGWAVYKPLNGTPYIWRNGEKIPAQEGFKLLSKDEVVTDNNDGIGFIDPNAIVIDPNDESYWSIKESRDAEQTSSTTE